MPDTLTETLADRAYEKVVNAIKVIGSSMDCPSHDIFFCGCAKAMAQMHPRKIVTAKRHYYTMLLEMTLLSKDHAWTYTEDKPSHDAFTAAEGQTPKHFIRQLLQGHDTVSKMIAPSGKLDAAIQATLELWLARNKQWRERYGERQTARQKWIGDAYPEIPPNRETIPHSEATRKVKVGDVIMVNFWTPMEDIGCYKGEHGFKVRLSKLTPTDGKGRTPYGVCVEKLDLCHPDCAVGRRLFEENLEEAAKRVLPKLEAREGEKRVVS